MMLIMENAFDLNAFIRFVSGNCMDTGNPVAMLIDFEQKWPPYFCLSCSISAYACAGICIL